MSDKSLIEALCDAQAEMKNAAFNKTNPAFKSKYADLISIREAVLPVLNKHGITMTQGTVVDPERGFLQVTTIHKGGETLSSVWPLPKEAPQKMGSALTYARRYTLAALVGIASDEDDDGNAAQDQHTDSKANSRDKYTRIVSELRAARTKIELSDVQKKNETEIKSMPDDWRGELREEYATCLKKIKDQEAAIEKAAKPHNTETEF